jgi:hypothetical protein
VLKTISKFQHNKPLVLTNKAPNSRLKPKQKVTHGASGENLTLVFRPPSQQRWRSANTKEQGNTLTTLHYASGNNVDAGGNFTPAKAGFNLADVSSVDELNALPAGVKGLVWLDQGNGVTQSFIDAVTPYIGNPKAYGFFLTDEPDPTGQWNTLVTAEHLKAESDWIHAHVPGAKTFITMMNMGSSDNPSFANTYTPENTHIDYFGIDPYPVRSGSSTVDYNMIDKAVAAAEASGIPLANIVPVFQTFGGGNWVDDQGGHYVMPTAAQEQQMLAHWSALVPNAAFDYAYAWGSQNGDQALESSQALQNVFLQHNTSASTTPVADTSGSTTPADSTPVADTSGSTTPVDSTSGNTTPVVDTSGTTTPVDSTSGGTTTGSTASSGSTTPADTTSASTGSTPAGVPSNDPTTSPTTDVAGSGHHHHHGFDFSQLLGGGVSPGNGHHHASAVTAAVSAARDMASSSVTDATQLAHLDLTSHHGVQHTDHHSWHW